MIIGVSVADGQCEDSLFRCNASSRVVVCASSARGAFAELATPRHMFYPSVSLD